MSIVDGLNNTYNIGSAIKKLLKQLLIKQKRLQQISTLKLKDGLRQQRGKKKPASSKLKKKKKLKALEKGKLLNDVSEAKSSVFVNCYCEFDRNGNRELVKSISC